MIPKDYDREERDGLQMQKDWTSAKCLDKMSKSDVLFRHVCSVSEKAGKILDCLWE